MYVSHVAMSTTLRLVTQMAELHQEQHSRIFQRIGSAQSVVWEKMFSLLRSS